MRFWDTSALVALCVEEPASAAVRRILRDDPSVAVWWGTRIECILAFARRVREGVLNQTAEANARTVLARLTAAWTEIQPSEAVRVAAERLVAVHRLRAGDGVQLAAALEWSRGDTADAVIVTFDARLRVAAHREGFTLLPSDRDLRG